MIKNVVFDVNGVLLKFNFLGFLDIFGWTTKVQKDIWNILFASSQSADFMAGKIDNLTFFKALLKHYPKYSNEINQVFKEDSFEQIMLPNYDTIEFLKELKENNYKIYILSNMDESQVLSFKKIAKIDKYFDGEVYSYEVDAKKPNSKIYEFLLNKYEINPKQTIYIDDGKLNVETAKNLGFKAFVFKSAEETIPKIKSVLQKNLDKTSKADYVSYSHPKFEKA